MSELRRMVVLREPVRGCFPQGVLESERFSAREQK